MTAQSIRIDSYLGSTPPPSVEPELDLAMLRAYSIERSIDYGCSLEDVLKLRRRVESGSNWVEVALLLARDSTARAALERDRGRARAAAGFYLHASACYRLAQAALEERPAERLDAYQKNVAAFGSAMALLGYGNAGVDVLHRGRRHGAWLFRPDVPGSPPCVVVWGGADGWCEAFFGSVPRFLERGLAVCLLELPGQGLARLQNGSFLDARFTDMVAATLDELAARGVAGENFGVAGHSLGGSLALRAAAMDSRIRAACTNGGSVDMKLGLTKFPRVLKRVGRMIGNDASEADVLGLIDELDLQVAVSAMPSPVLCMHGGQDVLVTDEEAHRLLALRGAYPSTYEYWPEGIHCLNNHSIERDCVVASWFAGQLHGPAGSRAGRQTAPYQGE